MEKNGCEIRQKKRDVSARYIWRNSCSVSWIRVIACVKCAGLFWYRLYILVLESIGTANVLVPEYFGLCKVTYVVVPKNVGTSKVLAPDNFGTIKVLVPIFLFSVVASRVCIASRPSGLLMLGPSFPSLYSISTLFSKGLQRDIQFPLV